jgi:hypothetical protein
MGETSAERESEGRKDVADGGKMTKHKIGKAASENVQAGGRAK